MTGRRAGGMTLLEVLVALAVVAIAVAALARVGGQALDTQHALQQRTLALWVADNQLAELRLAAPVSAGRRQGRTLMGQQDWRWEALIQPAPGAELMRVDIAVYHLEDSDTPMILHTGFLPR